jgi:hypothetical protein
MLTLLIVYVNISDSTNLDISVSHGSVRTRYLRGTSSKGVRHDVPLHQLLRLLHLGLRDDAAIGVDRWTDQVDRPLGLQRYVFCDAGTRHCHRRLSAERDVTRLHAGVLRRDGSIARRHDHRLARRASAALPSADQGHHRPLLTSDGARAGLDETVRAPRALPCSQLLTYKQNEPPHEARFLMLQCTI